MNNKMTAVEQRRKEIGLRKVLGASLGGLLMLLSSDFMKWVLAGNLIAWPAAWFFSEHWLNGFAYRIDFPGWILPLAALISVMTAMATVGTQTVRTAMTDPVASLKCE